MVLDSIINDRDYEGIGAGTDRRLARALRSTMRADEGSAPIAALRRALRHLRTRDPDAAAELEELEHRLASG